MMYKWLHISENFLVFIKKATSELTKVAFKS